MFRRYLSPDGGSGGGETFTLEQVEQKIQEGVEEYKKNNPLNLQTASKFIENAGGKAFLSDNSLNEFLDSDKIKTSKTFQSEIDAIYGKLNTQHEKNIKELTGIEKQEGENVKQYIERAQLEFSKKKGGVSDSEFSAIQKKLQEKDTAIGEWEKKYNDLNQNVANSEKQSLIQKGIPSDKLAYKGIALDGALEVINKRINDNFDFKKDEKGWVAVNKTTGEPELNGEGKRKSLTEVASSFVTGMQDIEFTKESRQPNLPGGGSGELSEEAKKVALQKYEEEKQSKGIFYDHVEEAAELRKKYNISKPSDKTNFPTLFK